MGGGRRSRRISILAVIAVLGVVFSSGGALAQPVDPTATTDAPTTTTAAPPDTTPPTTTTLPAGGGGASPGTTGPSAAATPGGGTGGQSPQGPGGAPVTQAAVDDADLAVTKDAPPNPAAGTDVSYSITVTNNGPATATPVTLTDPVPAFTTYVSGVGRSGVVCGEAGGVITCTWPGITSGTTVTLTLTVHVNADAGGNFVNNQATVSAPQNDPNPFNNSDSAAFIAASQADVSVTKVDTPDPVVHGANITYTITVTNNGPGDARNTFLTDNLPFNATFVSATTPAGWSCGTPAPGQPFGEIDCLNGSLANGSSGTFTVVVQVSPTELSGSTVSNSAHVSAQVTDPNLANNDAQASTLVDFADLSLTKTDAPDPVVPGNDLSYSMTATNQTGSGGGTAQNVTVADSVPAHATFVSLTPPSGWSCTTPAAGGTGAISCTNPSMPVGAAATFTLVVHVDPGTSSGTVLSNTASVSSATGDQNPGNNSATATTTVGASADLAVTKTAPPTRPNQSDLTYGMTVTNNGVSAAQSVTLTDPLPFGTTFVSVSPPAGWSCTAPAVGSSGSVNCTIPALASGASAGFVLVVHITAAPGGFLNNTASVSATTGDPVASNNSSTASTFVTGPAFDVSVTKTGPSTAVAGTDITYNLTVANAGPSAVSGVTLSDPNPGGITWVSATPAQGSCSVSFAIVDCSFGSLASGASVPITVVAHVGEYISPGFVISNLAFVNNQSGDQNFNNQSAEVDTTVSATADLAVTKTDTPDPAAAGGDLTYAITVTDAGPSYAWDATMTDALPPGTTFVSLSQSDGGDWLCTTPPVGGTGTVSCALAVFPTGELHTFNLVVRIDPTATPGTVIGNTATVGATSSTDPNSGDDSASTDTTVVAGPDLKVTKSDAPDPVTAGNDLTYTMTATNQGSAPAQNTTLTDPLPAQTAFASIAAPAGWTCTTPAAGANGTVNCTIGTFVSGGSATFTVVVHVLPTTPRFTSISNTASVSTTTTEPNTGNNGATTSTGVVATVDLAVTKTGTPDPVIAGNTVTYTITATNGGPSTPPVTMSDVYGNGNLGTFVSLSAPAGWNCTTPAVGDFGSPSCTTPSMPVGQAVFTLVVRVTPSFPSGFTFDNQVTVFPDDADEADFADNVANTSTAVVFAADLTVAKSDAPDPVAPGGDLTYTITVTNNGPSDAPNFAFADPLPAGTTLVSLQNGPELGCFGPAPGDTGTVNCFAFPFGAGTSSVITVVVHVDPSTAEGTILGNTATASSTATDPNPADNSATASPRGRARRRRTSPAVSGRWRTGRQRPSRWS